MRRRVVFWLGVGARVRRLASRGVTGTGGSACFILERRAVAASKIEPLSYGMFPLYRPHVRNKGVVTTTCKKQGVVTTP